MIEHRRRLLSEWIAWREHTEADLREQRLEMNLPEEPTELAVIDVAGGDEESQVVEEIVEEIIKETEEVVG